MMLWFRWPLFYYSFAGSDCVCFSSLQDAWGLTALHWAASRGHEACVAALLAKGSDPTCTSEACSSSDGKTAADMASSAGYLGMAAFLSEASLVQAACKAQTGKGPASLISLQGNATQQQYQHFVHLLAVQRHCIKGDLMHPFVHYLPFDHLREDATCSHKADVKGHASSASNFFAQLQTCLSVLGERQGPRMRLTAMFLAIFLPRSSWFVAALYC